MLPQMDGPQPGGESSLELRRGPSLWAHPACLAQPGSDHWGCGYLLSWEGRVEASLRPAPGAAPLMMSSPMPPAPTVPVSLKD